MHIKMRAERGKKRMVRVTQGMLNTQLLRNLNNNLHRMDNLQQQLATGRRISKPSDDPVAISFALRYRSEIGMNEQHQRNVNDSLSWLSYTDIILDQAGQVLQRARELAVQGANGSNPQEALDSIKSEVEQLYEQMVDIANSRFNGKYVFNGQMTDKPPYNAATAAADVTDTGKIEFEIGAGVKIAVNITGEEVFGPAGGDNIFKVMQDLISHLENGDHTAVSNIIDKLDDHMNAFLAARADIGAKVNRVELAESRLQDININLQNLKSKNEDADMAEVIMNIKMAENVYMASLSAGARIIMPSLADFLR